MKVIIAIDSLKGCLSSMEAGETAADAVRKRYPAAEVVCIPVSDGGEGWLEAFGNERGGSQHVGWEVITAVVSDPLQRPVEARYLRSADLAVIEIAQACGLHLLRTEERNPLAATSRGVGELILDAAARGCRRFIIGLGGSATSDAGKGMIEEIREKSRKSRVGEWSGTKQEEWEFIMATDVTNPLCGPDGAAAVFAPQKGATPAMVETLDRRARAFAEENAQQMGFDKSEQPGAGAAGGLGYAFMQFFDAECRSGAELLLERLHFDDLIADADLLLTGEGHADRQTLMGKLPSIVLQHSLRMGIPCHLFAGGIADEAQLLAAGFSGVHQFTPPDMDLREAIRPEVARRNLRKAVGALLISEFPAIHDSDGTSS
jgi:glycerate kinase